MGTLRNITTGLRMPLARTTQVGRNAPADLRLDDASVSSLHALMSWQRTRWVLRDLGSTNGTTLDGTRLFPGVDVDLHANAEICFGSTLQRWVVEEVTPPRSMMVADDGGIEELKGSGVILPAPDAPDLLLMRDRAGIWWWHRDSETARLEDRQTLRVGQRSWRAYLDTPTPSTTDDIGTAGYSLLRFRVSLDEETIELECVHERDSFVLPSRAHSYLLLTLARQRLEEQQSGIGERDAGWVATDDLCNGLRISRGALYTQVYRARKQFEQAGHPVVAELIVEHRRNAAQLRLGVGKVEVTRG